MADLRTIRNTVCPIAKRHGVEQVYLFGSRARGEARADSDYDFLITKGKVDDLWKFAAFVEDLESALDSRVDVVTDTSPDEWLIAEAKKDAVLIYE